MYDLYDYPDLYSSYSIPSTSSSSSISSSSEALGAAIGSIFAAFGFFVILAIIFTILVIIAKWIIFKKAGRKPWESLIPIHSDIVVMEIGGIETYWYFLNILAIIPLIGWIAPLILYFWMNINLAKSFGKSGGFGVLTAFFPFICYPILGFGKAQYVGPQTAQYNYNANVNYGPAQQYNQPNQQYNPPAQPAQPVQPAQPAQPAQPTNTDNYVPPQQ